VKVGQWERLTGGLLTASAVVFLVAYAVPIIWPQSAEAVLTACSVAAWATWTLFAVHLAVRVVLPRPAPLPTGALVRCARGRSAADATASVMEAGPLLRS
jgi:hypothetical protein